MVHAALITALALSKTYVDPNPFVPIRLIQIAPEKTPPPVSPKTAEPKKADHFVKAQPVVQPTSQPNGSVVAATYPFEDPLSGGSGGDIVIPKQIDVTPPAPVRTAATLDARSEAQPPYPASEQRLGREGSVTVRLLVGADGRVEAVERVAATSDAFWVATQRQALRAWRFRPATVDGRPVESRFTMTVRFRLAG